MRARSEIVRPGAAIVTGASSGIGRELARICAQHGRDLVLIARSEDVLRDEGDAWIREHGIACHVMPADLSLPGAAAEVVREIERRDIRPEILINNAGFGLLGPFLETDLARELAMIQVNVTALVELTKRILPEMTSQGRGRVMNVASTAAFQPGPLMAVYYASKAFVLSFSEALATELEGTGVTVTALCPGPTRSGFQAVAGVAETRVIRSRLIPDAASVARFGYKAMLEGRRIAVPGLLNRFMVQSIRFLPRRTVTAVVRRVHMR